MATASRGSDMATDLTHPAPQAAPPAEGRRAGPIVAAAVLAGVGLAALAAVAVEARRGAVAARIANPGVEGAPRPVAALGGRTDWLVLHQAGTVVMMLVLVVGFVLAWRRHPRHPILLMVIVTTVLIWQDPIMNWAPYAVYNLSLIHI